ncbi:hypothetical protein BGZ60DRAFT_194179 [Tricladium varicosporioides]|nr:hypothetical protein BGZ60DRAFT_194179 [Hymenoscyphus varicosporioides]
MTAKTPLNMAFSPEWDLYPSGYSDMKMSLSRNGHLPRGSTISTVSAASTSAISEISTAAGEVPCFTPRSSGSSTRNVEEELTYDPHGMGNLPTFHLIPPRPVSSKPKESDTFSSVTTLQQPPGKPARWAPVITHVPARKRAIGTTEYIVYSADPQNPEIAATVEKLFFNDWRLDRHSVWTCQTEADQTLYWGVCLTKEQVDTLPQNPLVSTWYPVNKNPTFDPCDESSTIPLDEQYDKEICATKWLPKPKTAQRHSRRFSRLSNALPSPPPIPESPPRAVLRGRKSMLLKRRLTEARDKIPILRPKNPRHVPTLLGLPVQIRKRILQFAFIANCAGQLTLAEDPMSIKALFLPNFPSDEPGFAKLLVIPGTKMSGNWGREPMTRLLRLNKQLNTEADEILYRGPFHFDFSTSIISKHAQFFLSRILPKQKALVKNIKVNVLLDLEKLSTANEMQIWIKRHSWGLLREQMVGVEKVVVSIGFVGCVYGFRKGWEVAVGQMMRMIEVWEGVQSVIVENQGESNVEREGILETCRSRIIDWERAKIEVSTFEE